MDAQTEIRLRGIQITAQEIIDDLARGDYKWAMEHAQLIKDAVGGMLPQKDVDGQPCKHEITSLNPYNNFYYCDWCGQAITTTFMVQGGKG